MPKQTAKNLAQLQEQALEMFRAGQTKSAIASQLGVSSRTVQRWRNTHKDNLPSIEEALSTLSEMKFQNAENVVPREPKKQPEAAAVLKTEINISQKLLFDDDYRKILQLFSGTLDGLQSLLSDSNLSPRDRISAFRLVLELRRDVATFCSSPQQEQNSDLSDFELVKETLRQHVLSGTSPQGAIALLRLLQIQENLPESVLPSKRKAERQVMLSEISKMTPQEKMRLYREYTSKPLQ